MLRLAKPNRSVFLPKSQVQFIGGAAGLVQGPVGLGTPGAGVEAFRTGEGQRGLRRDFTVVLADATEAVVALNRERSGQGEIGFLGRGGTGKGAGNRHRAGTVLVRFFICYPLSGRAPRRVAGQTGFEGKIWLAGV